MRLLPMFLTKTVEKIPMGDALLLSLLGFAIVFAVLILLIIVITVMTAILRERKPAPSPVGAVEARAETAKAVTAGKVPALGSMGECMLHTVDDRTAALLMSIVADDLKAPLNELRFISIRELTDGRQTSAAMV